MDAADVVEIPSPRHFKKRGDILHDVIEIGEKVNTSKRRKTDEAIHQVVEMSGYTSIQPGVEDFGPAISHIMIGEKVSKSINGKTNLSSSQFSQTAHNKKGSASSQRKGHDSKHDDFADNSEVRNLLPPSAINFFLKQATINDRSHHAIMSKFQNFKQFDFVKDASGHHFIHKNSSIDQHSKNWVEVIQKERKILEKDLPDSIFVRFYESRMDLLRAVIVGADGTPYHNGLFFFDIYFPRYYPNIPPRVYSHSSNSLNPAFGASGRVHLSLLNSYPDNEIYDSKSENECWLPGISTVSQVLISIKDLVSNAKPFFSHPPGKQPPVRDAESTALLYNENVFAHSLSKMSYMMRRPPKYFEDFIVGHFVSRAHDILRTCKAYIKGGQVDFLVNDGARGVVQSGLWSNARCVELLRLFMNTLVIEISRIGAKNCENFLSAAIIKEGQVVYQFYEGIKYAKV